MTPDRRWVLSTPRFDWFIALFDGHFILSTSSGVRQWWEHVRLDENPQGPSLPWTALKEPTPLESEHHLVNGGRCHAEEALHVCLGRRLPMDQGVHPDEGQILPLKGREGLASPVVVCSASSQGATPQTTT